MDKAFATAAAALAATFMLAMHVATGESVVAAEAVQDQVEELPINISELN
ncbi:hypothetical protein [Parvularcula oceani]|nr:hypothetical protein [Parvularcula oceani]